MILGFYHLYCLENPLQNIMQIIWAAMKRKWDMIISKLTNSVFMYIWLLFHKHLLFLLEDITFPLGLANIDMWAITNYGLEKVVSNLCYNNKKSIRN